MAMQCNIKLSGKTAMVLPTGCPHIVVLLAGICWMENQSPCYSPGLGAWLQMTGVSG